MKIVFITHPKFLKINSMMRFAAMLNTGMKERGYDTEEWTAEPYFARFGGNTALKKYLGYLDQFIVFPFQVKRKLRKKINKSNLYVFTDQSLGPWVPYFQNHAHVIHCHDFTAQRAAMGDYPEHQLSLPAKKYQAFIRSGFKKGKYFISISEKTQQELHYFLDSEPELSEVVYNGLNRPFYPEGKRIVRSKLADQTRIPVNNGYFFHIGSNDFYKNRKGVIAIYDAWRCSSQDEIPLLLIGPEPNEELKSVYENSAFKNDIYFCTGWSDDKVILAYQGATALLFPSLYEGFGWPIAEAMASGCLVVTTGEAPMTEVGGEAAFYIPKKRDNEESRNWAKESSTVLQKILALDQTELQLRMNKGIQNAQRFDTQQALDKIEAIYKTVSVKAAKNNDLH